MMMMLMTKMDHSDEDFMMFEGAVDEDFIMFEGAVEM